MGILIRTWGYLISECVCVFQAKRLIPTTCSHTPHPHLHRPLCPLFNTLFVIYVVGFARYLEHLRCNIWYSDEAGSSVLHTDGAYCNQHSQKNGSYMSPELILFMIAKTQSCKLLWTRAMYLLAASNIVAPNNSITFSLIRIAECILLDEGCGNSNNK